MSRWGEIKLLEKYTIKQKGLLRKGGGMNWRARVKGSFFLKLSEFFSKSFRTFPEIFRFFFSETIRIFPGIF